MDQRQEPTTDRLLLDRVAVVTGAGRGIGREYALLFAKRGAKVVVNDFGGARDGKPADSDPSSEVVEEIRALGGEAVASVGDVTDWDYAEQLVQLGVDTYGKVDVLVNNAGILRDRSLVNMTPEEWDDVIRVHLRGTAGPAHFAARHWRDRSKAGEALDARLINTTSTSGLFGRRGQCNYGAAKAGIATLTIIAAEELAAYGVTANALAPIALTRLTDDIMSEEQARAYRPESVAPFVTWLASPRSREVTGQVFCVGGPEIYVVERWRRGLSLAADGDWSPEDFDRAVPGLLGLDAGEGCTRGVAAG